MKNKFLTVMMFSAVLAWPLTVPAVHAQTTAAAAPAQALNRITALQSMEQNGMVYLRLTMSEAVAAQPLSFTVANPSRIVVDLPATENTLGRTQQEIGQGDLRSANIVQVGDRTRLVLNVNKIPTYDVRVDGKEIVIALAAPAAGTAVSHETSEAVQIFADTKSGEGMGGRSIRDIRFRRGNEGEGRVVVQLSSADTGIDIRQQGADLIVDFLDTQLPESLHRRSDVTDFGTPVTSMRAQPQGDGSRLIVTPTGLWEHNAYQSDTQFVLEVRRVAEDPNKLVQGQGPGYKGERLSLNFQNIDVRSVLQVIADFTDFNIVTSDSVQGQLTLRLQDVPWDQALDIILQSKGLDKRKVGNVIWIAPSDELAAREKMEYENLAQLRDLEPLQTESFQVNYHKAAEIYDFLKMKDQTLLSSRGSIVFDDRSNKIFVTDVPARLDDVRRVISEIDISPRQVLIEARIVEATKTFSRDLGVRLGAGGAGGKIVGYDSNGQAIRQTTIGGGLGSTAANAGQVGNLIGDNMPGGLNVNMPVENALSGAISMVLWNNSATRFLNLELSALESDGRGRIISSPRVLTANQVEALIKQGTEIPYQEASSSGATSVSFKEAVLALKVRPQITPDGRLQMSVEVNKDRPLYENALLGVPPIETKTVKTEVLINNGGTVVIGGIYEETDETNVDRIPLLGELPYVGALFRNTMKNNTSRELLVFLTPRIVTEDLVLH